MPEELISRRHYVQSEMHVDAKKDVHYVNLRTAKRVAAEAADEKADAGDVEELARALQNRVADNDKRLSDDRNPTKHASSHMKGGSDAISPEDIGAVDESDKRLSDPRFPTTHAESHGKNGDDVITPGSIGAVPNDDPRLSNHRQPTNHASSHALGGSDQIALSDIGALPPPPGDGKSYLAVGDGWVEYIPPEIDMSGILIIDDHAQLKNRDAAGQHSQSAIQHLVPDLNEIRGNIEELYTTKAEGGHTHDYLPMAGGSLTGNLVIPASGNISFGNAVGTKLNLYGGTYTIGIESNTLSFTSGGQHKWYSGAKTLGYWNTTDLYIGSTGVVTTLNTKANNEYSFYDATITKVGTEFRFQTSRSLPSTLPPLVTVRGVTPADFSSGDTVKINDTTVAMFAPGLGVLPESAWLNGDAIEILWNTGNNKAFFKFGTGGKNSGHDGWNISVGNETPVTEGIHLPDATVPTKVFLDSVFELFSGDIKQVSSGAEHSLILLHSGQVLSCGGNSTGQLGRSVANGSTTSVNLGVISGVSDVVAIAAGGNHSLFLKSDGTVLSCGNNASGQLGRSVSNGTATSVNLGIISGVSDVVEISAGGSHSLFVKSDGTVFSCGDNSSGQLGRSVAKGTATSVNLGIISGVSGVVAIGAGGSYSLFLKSDGTALSCGNNSSGQLGRSIANGTATSVNLGTISGVSDVTAVAAGGSHSLFVKSDGTALSCGSNSTGQLGRSVANGSTTSVNLGVISGVSDVIAISAAMNQSLLLMQDGAVFSCGENIVGQLGRSAATGNTTSVNLGVIPGGHKVIAVAAGQYHSLFITSSGAVLSCGSNNSGQLGRLVATGGASSINLNEMDLSEFSLGGEPTPLPYDEGSILIREEAIDASARVKLIDDGFASVYGYPKEVFQIINGEAVKKDFEIRKAV